jgi:branched-chain amino acid transport system ATP-binding protein
VTPLLALDGIAAGYGSTIILDALTLRLGDGETCAILGRNGVGKTTLLRTVMGHTTLHRGAIRFAARDLTSLPPHRRARAGIGFVPQEREIFPSLSVEENLTVARRGRQWTTERVFELFPRLAERRRNMGGQLSGGEQQMLSIGRALMGSPRLLLMDEPLEGLAPIIVENLVAAMEKLRAAGGLAILLVEQHTRRAFDFADRAVILDRGRIVHDGPSAPLRQNAERLAALMGLSGPRGTA